MLSISIPGGDPLAIEHLVLDYNGTLAVDGALLPGVSERLIALAGQVQVHVITADTFGMARAAMQGLPCELVILPPGGQDVAKLAYVERLGAPSVAAIGNGRNDWLMLQTASLGIAVLGEEGAAAETLAAADVMTHGITSALDLLLNPRRLVATLRR
jgi:soluble P-type ATPase